MSGSILHRDELSDVYFDLSTAFDEAFETASPQFEQTAMVDRTDAPLKKYKWLGEVPKMRKWVGQRQIEKLEGESHVIENEDWANGIEWERDDMRDDNLGLLGKRIGNLAKKGFDAMDAEVIAFYLAGFATTLGTTYDGQALISATHTASGHGGTAQSNLQTGTVSSANVNAAYDKMIQFKDRNGEPLNIQPRWLLHGPTHRVAVRDLLVTTTLPNGGANPDAQLLIPIMSKRITGTEWFVLGDDEVLAAIILQIRQDPMLRLPEQSMNDMGPFMNKKFVAGADATFGVGYGAWQLVVGSTG